MSLSAQHIQLASESFTYTEGESIVGKQGGLGWSTAWTTTTAPGFAISSENPLVYPNLIHAPEHLSGGNGQSLGRRLDLHSEGSFASYLSNGLIGAPGTTLYIYKTPQRPDHNLS